MTQKSLIHVKNVIFTQAEWACSQGKLIKRGKTDRMQFLDTLTLQFCTWVLITLKICSQRSSALICLHLVPRVFHLPSPRGKPQGEEGKKRGPGNELGFALQLLPDRQGRSEGKFFPFGRVGRYRALNL